jgi:hypothetical protein
MSGSGGYKHRKHRRLAKLGQARKKARANLARVKNQFEQKGQAWDPTNNQAQLAALSHTARHQLQQPK